MKIQWTRTLICALLLAASHPSMATIQKQSFSITGSAGEFGTGSFTWDDATVPNGTALNDSNISISLDVISLNISITDPLGNNIVGTTSFTLSDCTGASLELTPDFTNDINFSDCDNGSYSLNGANPFQAVLAPRFSPSPAASNITFTPGPTTAAASPQPTHPVPTMSTYGLALTVLGLMLLANRRIIH